MNKEKLLEALINLYGKHIQVDVVVGAKLNSTSVPCYCYVESDVSEDGFETMDDAVHAATGHIRKCIENLPEFDTLKEEYNELIGD